MQSLSSHTKHNRWLAIALIAIAVGGLLVAFWFSSGEALQRNQNTMSASCKEAQLAVSRLFPVSESLQQQVANPELMYQSLQDSIKDAGQIQGGFWHTAQGFMGFAFTNAGDGNSGVGIGNEDIPIVRSAVQRSLEQQRAVVSVQAHDGGATVVAACPEKNHYNLGIWLKKEVQLVPPHFTLIVSVLFVALAIIGGILIVCESVFNRNWHIERDRIVAQAEDNSQAVSVTTEIPEIQPLLMLLYQARQKIQAKERELSQQMNKVIMANQKTLIGRIARSMSALAVAELEEIRRKLAKTNADDIRLKVSELTELFESFDKVTSEAGNGRTQPIEAESFLEELSDYHESHGNVKDITLTSIAEKGLKFDAEPLLLRFSMDYLLRHIMSFAPDNSEIMLQATAEGDFVKIAISDESTGIENKNKHLLFHADELAPTQYGIGLKVVRDTLQSQNGDISYEKLEKTSRFNVLIPMTKA
ncbi:GHKL domain-containing protein [Idiomarina sp. HP20-50]|uniref:GHKL domain-containing protein n=1 Tax=Idiomarina sp. HP20-50 TaxID=3070813 RepID=UPI00294B99BD|nr:GHKL domain-containing protein [Idiomarina sp. HP20-50]MDV6315616.1 sensor histidine kinase [Idiomarina sp. HP20-50]